jgi:hypothetical protein
VDRPALLVDRLMQGDRGALDVPMGQPPDPDSMGAGLGAAWNGVTDWLRAQKQKSAEMGLYNPETGWPTMKGWGDAAQQYAGTFEGGIKGYHGSPHSFDKFRSEAIGTGEGAQAFGHGLYFAEREGTAKSYRDALTPGADVAKLLEKHGGDADAALSELLNDRGFHGPRSADYDALLQYRKTGVMPSKGSMYEVNINADPEHFLHWDKPLSEQSPHVQQAMSKVLTPDNYRQFMEGQGRNMTAGEMHDFTHRMNPAQFAADAHEAGIPGIRYYDQGSRSHLVKDYESRLAKWKEQVEYRQAHLQAAEDGMQKVEPGSRAHNAFALDAINHRTNLETAQTQLQRLLDDPVEVTHNIVAFDENTIEILRKYGLAGLGLGGAAAATAGAQEPGS